MSAYPNAYHYLRIATENPSAPGTPVAPQKGIRYESFDPGVNKEEDEDKGASGSKNPLINIDITRAYSEPNFTDRLRFDDALGYFLKHYYGTDVVTRNIPSTGLSYSHAFAEAASLDTATLTEGFNVGSETAKTMSGCQCNSLEFKFSLDAAPRITASYIGGYRVHGATEPSLTYATTRPAQAGQIDVYCDAYGGTIGSTLLPGVREISLTLNNGLTAVAEAADDFGETSIDQDLVSITGSLTRRYDGTDYERIFDTGSDSGTTPTTEPLEKLLRVKYTGPMIETIYPYIFQLDILRANVKVKSPRGMEGMKTEEWEIKGLANASGLSSAALLQNKIATYEYIAP